MDIDWNRLRTCQYLGCEVCINDRDYRAKYCKRHSRERKLKRHVKYRKENPDKVREYKRKYRKENYDKTCEYNRKYRKENYDKILKREYVYRKENPKKILLKSAKDRCKKKNLKISIEEKDITIPKICPLLRINITADKNRISSPSLDRIDSKKGYTKDNTQVISSRANNLKSDATLDELILIGKWAQKQKKVLAK